MQTSGENEITVSQMEALLAELQDAREQFQWHMSIPFKSSTNNYTKTADGQSQRYQARRSLTNYPDSDKLKHFCKDQSSSLGQDRTKGKHAGTSSVEKVTSFSTYAAFSGGADDLRESSTRQTPVPMGIRLAPINALTTGSKPSTANTLPTHRPSKGDLKSGLMMGPFIPANPLSQLLAEDAIKASSLMVQSRVDVEKNSIRYDGDYETTVNARKVLQEISTSFRDKGKESDSNSTEYYAYESNFLPIMCALHLSQGGIKPTPRWGHTLTPIGEDQLFMFGGMETSTTETSTLMVFDRDTLEWNPAYVMPNDISPKELPSAPPTARYNHAACGYEGGYLVIYGGAALHGRLVYNDICMYNTVTSSWKCLWKSSFCEKDTAENNTNNMSARKSKKNEPAPRFGHSMVVNEDRLYIFGGKVIGQEGFTISTSTDVYVFSMSSRRWKKRIRANAMSADILTGTRSAMKWENAEVDATRVGDNGSKVKVPRDGKEYEEINLNASTPCARAYHAASIKGDIMYINGGCGANGNVLSDTWQLNLKTGVWIVLHRGNSSDAIPRERHKMFACGEAIMVIGGCSTTPDSTAVSAKFAHFVSVLPLMGQTVPCWVPVAMGNASIISPSQKNFAAAFSGGFVYVFGGNSGTQTATNGMARFLATDGYASEAGKDAVLHSEESLRSVMQKLQEKGSFTVPYDILALVDVAGNAGEKDNGREASNRPPTRPIPGVQLCPDDRYQVGFHRVMLQQRAPRFLERLLACRSEPFIATPMRGGVEHGKPLHNMCLSHDHPTGGASVMNSEANHGDTDALDALLMQSSEQHQTQSYPAPPKSCRMRQWKDSMPGVVRPAFLNYRIYYVQGNTRVKGLPHALTGEELRCLAHYIYCGGLKAKFRLLLKDEDEEKGVCTKISSVEMTQRQQLRSILTSLRTAADDYDLKPLRELTEALLEGNRQRLREARQYSTRLLRDDMLELLNTAKGATVTVLFIDPHTKQKKTQALHPLVLTSFSSFFAHLLRPIFREGKSSIRIDNIVAKLSASDHSDFCKPIYSEEQGHRPGSMNAQLSLKASSPVGSKTSIIVGPIAVPFPAIPVLLRYLYTKQLHVPQQLALETMMGSHSLGLSLLKAHCEAIVGRSDVNYESCCSFYFLSKRYKASLLQEMALLTAVSGYSKVRSQAAFHDLPEEDRKIIESLSLELGSHTWVPPQQPTQEMKTPSEYARRWNAISLI